jgi:ribose/xylose/arabinose/galactoside ABC-type transport system permease subunit
MTSAARRILNADVGSRVALAAIVYAIFAATDSHFRTEGTFFAVFEGFALVGLIGLGLSVTIIAGELDLSVGSAAAVAAIVAVYASGLGLVPAVLIATAGAAVFGAVQGFAIARLKISSLVFTVGTLIGLRGVAYVIAHNQTVNMDYANLTISDSISQRFWIFSPFSLTALGAFVVVGLFLAYSRYGREIYAIGGGRNEARAAGVSTMRPIIIAFGISAATAGLAGSLAALKSGAAAPGDFNSTLLDAATVALVGGISLYGGRGNVVRVILGALTLRFLISGLDARGAQYYVESLATGALLLGVIAVEFFVRGAQFRKRFGDLFASSPPAIQER